MIVQETMQWLLTHNSALIALAQAENPIEAIVMYWAADLDQQSQLAQIDAKVIFQSLLNYQHKQTQKRSVLSQIAPCMKTPGIPQAFAALLFSVSVRPELAQDSIQLFLDLVSAETVKSPDTLIKDYNKTT